MSNIDKQAQKELYAKVEQQAHSLRGSPREYQALTGLCPVNVIEMHAQKIQALLDELEAKDKRIESALSLLSDVTTKNVWEIIGRLNVVISGDYRSEDEIAAGKGEA
ncbi:hypothetical protein NLX76_02490 [Enterobacter hormaechei]|uniref:hypothetical protein n=1 Tax=Enterobacter hormaechei TaxID=158836 RepID=UPI0020B82A7C|nr:hypothetical protein [Enterobacter hormaechei]EHF4952203.1 hypothetical protein [Enterobacter hormaechei]MCP3812789.1 hypothetical protein [Enterobacter hormaechei]MCP3823003.1 hypothetical protein [Enterobacter hormaechei]MCW4624448.1 hypothetical protein [Enterobacter hormaechei]